MWMLTTLYEIRHVSYRTIVYSFIFCFYSVGCEQLTKRWNSGFACNYLFLFVCSIATESRTRHRLYPLSAGAVTMKRESKCHEKLYWFTPSLQCFDYIQIMQEVRLFCPFLYWVLLTSSMYSWPVTGFLLKSWIFVPVT